METTICRAATISVAFIWNYIDKSMNGWYTTLSIEWHGRWFHWMRQWKKLENMLHDTNIIDHIHIYISIIQSIWWCCDHAYKFSFVHCIFFIFKVDLFPMKCIEMIRNFKDEASGKRRHLLHSIFIMMFSLRSINEYWISNSTFSYDSSFCVRHAITEKCIVSKIKCQNR